MAQKLETLAAALTNTLGDKVVSLVNRLDEITLTVAASDWLAVARLLRDTAALRFEQCIDISGIDYSHYKDGEWDGARFAAVCHLLSVSNDQLLRVRVFAVDVEFLGIDSVVDGWPGANWFGRQAVGLFGIVFSGHPDLRRILTDYGFVGHPFRKDFPLSGYVEMRYDPEQQRVVYQPVTIEPREITPRIIREETYGG